MSLLPPLPIPASARNGYNLPCRASLSPLSPRGAPWATGLGVRGTRQHQWRGEEFAPMATYRFPVLIWQDFEGFHTASLVEWEERAALGPSAGAARQQLEEFLSWSYGQKPWL